MNTSKRFFSEDILDLLILDEIIISVRDGFLKEEELLELLDEKPRDIEVIITGRRASEKLIKKVDLVTENKEIKHPFSEGFQDREGIEY